MVDGADGQHEQVNGLYLRIVDGELSTPVDAFVGEVIDGMAQNLQSAASLAVGGVAGCW